ncbi:RDD family protein [Coraliomargarita algicola]|uniref:RDD family protein n=1 Tax=Coraliomargarita algicola TaxID=3092156 RepID=A0ABZ0RJL9_9BACT|nr:RDD family protein [Coraliomargarita sp. J2-16]WPJ95278.1 RDD family protein [Coraliomargarita sp. J2-16]
MHERDHYAGFWCRFLALIIDYNIVMLAMFPFFVVGGLIFPNAVLVEDPYGLFSTERVIEERVETVNHPDGSYSREEQQIVEKTVLGHWVYWYRDVIVGVDVGVHDGAQDSRTLIDPETREPLDWISYEDFILFVLLIYWTTLESSRHRASLGKRVLGIEVTNAEGAQLSWPQALGRNLGKLLSVMLLFVGFMMVGWTNRKQGLHDKMARCILVRR